MATVLEPEAPAQADDQVVVAAARQPILRRPSAIRGGLSWFTSVDHKKIGILYGVTAFVFFCVGGVEALLIRLQLARPNGTILSADAYNQIFTMHGTTMIFLVVMPVSAAFANYLVPIMIGARDVAFPRLNAFSYWCFLLGGLFLYSSFLLGGAPDGGWFGYAPNTSVTFSPGHRIDFWVLGLQILGIASTTGAVNLVVTTLNMRAKGMTLLRMPIFVWMSLVAQFLVLFAMPVITIALFLLMFDRTFGANFFNPAAGGDPVLWQHLFWIFGHPEVYILILPAMGIVSEIIPTFARKPLFGYPVMVISGIAIGFMGWGVWVHHMFSVGLGPVAVSAFSVSTMFIAVPTGVKIFNWIGTLWGGSIKLSTPMLYAIGFVAMFTIGGLSGVTHAVSPHDRQQTDTYYIVAHFHYVLFGGALFGIMGGFFYWWPKVFGHKLHDGLGKLQFWLWFIGFNATFGPFHILGLQGMPRRIDSYPSGMGWDVWNMVATVGAFVIALAVVVFIVNVIVSARSRVPAEGDPWDGRTLEWSTVSPTPHYNFAVDPEVHALDDWWHRKYTEDESGRLVRLPNAVGQPQPDAPELIAAVHLPSPSYFPLVAALGLPVLGYGMVYKVWVVAVLGGIITLSAIYAWAFEPSVEPGGHDDGHGIDPAPHGDEPTPELVPAGVSGDVAVTEAEPVPAEGGGEA
jgi:cytochrome c oxidase subunit I